MAAGSRFEELSSDFNGWRRRVGNEVKKVDVKREEEEPLDVHKQKKRRHGPPMIVCINCHAHKLKCDKKRPCLHCQRRRRKCVYQDEMEGDQAKIGVDSAPTSTSSTTHSSPEHSLVKGSSSKSIATTRVDRSASYDSDQSDSHEQLRKEASDRWDAFKKMVQSDSKPENFFLFESAPTTDYISHNWFDHLLSFFGPNKTSGRRMISSLLERSLQPSHYYWFEMYHRPTIRRQMTREDERHRLNPAIAFALMAIALRRRIGEEATTYGHGSGSITLIPSEVLPPPRGPNDLSERLKEEAEKYFNQAILTADKATGSWLQIAQAATLLMQLEMEVSPNYLRYLYLAAIFFRAPSLQIALDQEAKSTVAARFQKGPLTRPITATDVKRSSVTMEVAARLRLLPLWVGSRVGTAFPNIEFHQTHFKEVDVQEAYSFAPWPDERIQSGDSKDAYACSLQARIIGLSLISTGLGARFMPYGLNYADPPEMLGRCLRTLDDSEFILDLSRDVIDLEENSYYRLSMVRLIVSICHMQGVVIRRCNLAHCDALRGLMIAKLRGESPSSSSSKMPRLFKSAALELWADVMQVYITEFHTDHLTYTTAGGFQAGVPLHISRYQLDVVRLYVAATFQLRGGVINTLTLVEVAEPMEDPLVKRLTDVAGQLQDCIQQHLRLMEEAKVNGQHPDQGNFHNHTTDVSLPHPQADYVPISNNINNLPFFTSNSGSDYRIA